MASTQNGIKDPHTYSPVPQLDNKDETKYDCLDSSLDTEKTTNKKETIPISGTRPLTEREEDNIILTVITMFILVILVWYLWPSQKEKEDHAAPIFILNTLFVSNFSAGTGGLVATWDAKLTVINNSSFSDIRFQSLGVTITYRGNPLSEDYVGPYLVPGETATFRMRFMNRGTAGWRRNEPYLEHDLVSEISNYVTQFSSLDVGMKLKGYASYYDKRKGSPFLSYKFDNEIMTSHIEDLKIQFLPNHKDLGKLANGNMNFSTPILQRTYEGRW